MAIVWPCVDGVETYVAAGRLVVVPRLECPSCRGALVFWSGYQRSVRVDGVRCLRLWIRRGRCGRCRRTHALIPSFLLVGRLDVVEVIGTVIAGVVSGGGCLNRVARRVRVAYTTGRDWVRRFVARAGLWLAGFSALAVELGGSVPDRWPAGDGRGALVAAAWAWTTAQARLGVLTPGLWPFVALVSGGTLIGTTTNPRWTVFGRRRFMPPVPMSGPEPGG